MDQEIFILGFPLYLMLGFQTEISLHHLVKILGSTVITRILRMVRDLGCRVVCVCDKVLLVFGRFAIFIDNLMASTPSHRH